MTQVAAVLAFVISHTTFLAAQDDEMGRCPKVCRWQVSLVSSAFPIGEGLDTEIPLHPSNLRPFGAPPSVGRREYPREPLPLEGAAERSEAGLASFFCGEATSSFPSRLCFGYSRILVSQPSPRGNAIKLSGRTFLAPHRGSCPKGLCKRTGFLGVKRRENPVRRHFERSEMRGLRSGIA